MLAMTVDRFRDWLEYEVEAHRRVLESLASVPEAARGREQFRRAVDVFVHVIAARRLWLSRFGALEEPEELFPNGVAFESLAPLHEATYAAWREWLAGVGDGDLDTEFEYSSFGSDERFASTYAEILTQLFGHSWYHRGQIAMLVRQCGGEPAVTDYVYLTRRRVGAGA
jgi:uncharacterized damage-inducible protein DinB